MSDLGSANPSDEEVEESIKAQRDHTNRRKNSIEPSFLESDDVDRVEEVTRSTERKEAREEADEDYEDLSSDKEEDTTEGEITDTQTGD
jgi:hypothetical protein